MIEESNINTKKIWYFGNNRSPNLRLEMPSWDSPFFLTDNVDYARDYADYGVYKIVLKGQAKKQILDFSNDRDISKLNWPKVLIEKIRAGNNDLNSLAFDMYELCIGKNDLYYIDDSSSWRIAAKEFQRKSALRKSAIKAKSHWADEKDYAFLLEMWKDIQIAGFDGFTHKEFGNNIIALFSLDAIDKIAMTKEEMQLQ